MVWERREFKLGAFYNREKDTIPDQKNTNLKRIAEAEWKHEVGHVVSSWISILSFDT